MTKAEALHSFMSSFGIPTYPNQAEANAAFPYLVYEQTIGSIDDGAMPIVINLWYYGDSLLPIVSKSEEISKAIGLGGVYVPCDGGAILIQRGTPFSQPQTDAADDKIKGRYMERCFLPGNHSDETSAQRLLSRGVSVISIKKGKQGSIVYAGGEIHRGGIYPAKVLKTFGAGDAYSGAFNYGLLRGLPMDTTLRYAAAASSITISGHSCSDSTPTLQQVQDYIVSHEYSV